MALKEKDKKRDILVRDIPEDIYNWILEEQFKALKSGERKSLSAIAIELIKKGASKAK